MEIQAFLNYVRGQAGYENQIEHIEHIAPAAPLTAILMSPST